MDKKEQARLMKVREELVATLMTRSDAELDLEFSTFFLNAVRRGLFGKDVRELQSFLETNAIKLSDDGMRGYLGILIEERKRRNLLPSQPKFKNILKLRKKKK